MPIDAHQHYWRYRPDQFPWIGPGMQALARDFLPEHGLRAMQAAGIGAAIAVQARPLEAETDELLALAAAHPHIAAVIGWAELSAPSFGGCLERWCAQAAFAGLRPMLQDLPDAGALLAEPAFNRGVDALQARGKVFELLLTSPQLPMAHAFCARHDRHWLVLDHAGKPRIRDGEWEPWLAELRALAALPHVACKLSGLVTEADWQGWDETGVLRYARAVLDIFGADRVVFGSDWPVCTLAADYAQVAHLARHALAAASAQERAAVFGGNAARIYSLAVH